MSTGRWEGQSVPASSLHGAANIVVLLALQYFSYKIRRFLDSLGIFGRKTVLLSYVSSSQPGWEKSNSFNIIWNEK